MRHLGRTHGIVVAWLNEAYSRGEFEIVYEPSCTMAADVFTKTFSNPQSWDAACSLVNICDLAGRDALCARAGAPLPSVAGGGKRGLWHLNPDGSGTWTRIDPAAMRLCDLRLSGPARSEVTFRQTFDRETGDLLDTTLNFAACTDRCPPLVPPGPRAIRSVFHFLSTKAHIPPEALTTSTDPEDGHKPQDALTCGAAFQPGPCPAMGHRRQEEPLHS